MIQIYDVFSGKKNFIPIIPNFLNCIKYIGDHEIKDRPK